MLINLVDTLNITKRLKIHLQEGSYTGAQSDKKKYSKTRDQ